MSKDLLKSTCTLSMTFGDADRYQAAAEEMQYVCSAVEGVFEMMQTAISLGQFDETEMLPVLNLCRRGVQHVCEHEVAELTELSALIFKQKMPQAFPEIKGGSHAYQS